MRLRGAGDTSASLDDKKYSPIAKKTIPRKLTDVCVNERVNTGR